jgi:hypothetical protein
MRLAIFVIATLVIAEIHVGCADMYMNSHQLFIRMMDTYISTDKTIEELKTFSGPNGIASDNYLAEITTLKSGDSEYHYDYPNLWGRHCSYYLLVDGKSQKVVGWGFDYEKGDPKKECGVRG